MLSQPLDINLQDPSHRADSPGADEVDVAGSACKTLVYSDADRSPAFLRGKWAASDQDVRRLLETITDQGVVAALQDAGYFVSFP